MELEEAKEQLKSLKKDMKKDTKGLEGIFVEDIQAISKVLQELDRLQKENERYKRIKPVSIDGEYEIDLEEFLNVSDKLYELERNSISKDKISQKIDNRISTVEKLLDEMIDKRIGCINLSYLSEREKEEVMNKRNCLLVQKATLIDIKKDLLKEE